MTPSRNPSPSGDGDTASATRIDSFGISSRRLLCLDSKPPPMSISGYATGLQDEYRLAYC